MLTAAEKDSLYQLIRIGVGDNATIKAYRTQFNLQTVAVVETMLSELAKCNDSIKSLMQDLAGGGKTVAKGWLKKALGQAHKQIKKSDQWNVAACRNTVASKWTTAIVNTVI